MKLEIGVGHRRHERNVLTMRNATDWLPGCRNMKENGDRSRGSGRPQKTWQECANNDVRKLGLCKQAA